MDLIRLRYKRFHISYLLASLCAGLLLGLLYGRGVTLYHSTVLLFIGLVLLTGSLRSQRWWAVPIIIIAGVCFGTLRGSSVSIKYDSFDALFEKSVTLQGVLSGDAQTASGGKQKITLSQVVIDEKHYPGEVFVSVFSEDTLKRGDTVILSGKLREGFASYGAAVTAGKVQSVSRSTDLIRDLRERFASTVRAYVIEPMASLGLGFVVGQRSTLPDSLDEQLKIVGLTHIVVASGYNLTILVRFMMRLFVRHSRYLAFTTSLLIIVGFVLFSGFSPSMNRAVIVTMLSLLAWYVGRRFHPVFLILYVAAVTAIVNPMYVWADLGWYLSFFAFGGILIVAPLVMKLVYRRRQPSPVEQLVVETMSAEVVALPLIAFSFGTLPSFALLANLLVAPLIPFAMAMTALTGVFGFMSTVIATGFALPTTVVIGYMIAVVEWLSALPGAQYEFELSIEMLLLWYGLLVGALIFVKRLTHYNFYLRDNRLEP